MILTMFHKNFSVYVIFYVSIFTGTVKKGILGFETPPKKIQNHKMHGKNVLR